MRWLLDNNLSVQLVDLLSEAGHDVAHVRSYGMQSASDQEVLERARQEDRVLVSADTDFGRILARSGATAPSVLLLRQRTGRRPQSQALLVLANLEDLAAQLEIGCLVVLDERTVRVRRLPIR
ncbi:MAG: DUF5615 family PIN-like protein [Actinomycetota bacterium]|nr:DUF5615 family PIN-like protein [Actinomycetota bacterium]